MADQTDDKLGDDSAALSARVADLEREVEDLRAMWALNREADEQLEEAIRTRRALDRTMAPMLGVLCAHLGAAAAWVRTFDERLELRDFSRDAQLIPADLDELYERVRKSGRYVRRWASGWTFVGQVLDVAGEPFGVAGVLVQGKLEAEDQARVSRRLEVWCEELDNHLASIALMRHKVRVTKALGDALKNPVLDEGLAEAIDILYQQLRFGAMLLLFRHVDDVEGTSINYKVVRDGQIVHDSSAPSHAVVDALVRAEAIRAILGQPTVLMGQLGMEGLPARQEVLISGVKNQQILGRVLVTSADGEFGTFDRDLLERFAEFIRLRIGDFNREWKQLSLTFSPPTIRRLLRHEGYRERFLSPREVEAAVLFADLAGFTRLCESLGQPALIGRLINAWSRAMVDIVWDTGGVFDKMVGDCVIGLWGPPFYTQTSVEIGRQAVEAARRMRAATVALGETRDYGDRKLALDLAVGVNLCPLLVGQFGPNDDFTAFSSGMNNTARLQGVARAGEVLCMESLVELLGEPEQFGELRTAAVKNVAQPLRFRPLV